MSTTPTPDLGSIITSTTARKIIYSVYGILAFVVAAIQVGFSAAAAGQPVWLTVTLAVVAFIGTAVGGLAVANTGTPAVITDPVQGE